MNTQWKNSRSLVERIVVTCDLVLDTPTHLGNGDGDSLLDMPLHLDALEGRALLTGTSLAGGLRGYVYRYSSRLAARLFGFVTNQSTEESRLIIDDALGDRPRVELRDGVAIEPSTRTAVDGQKYDMELLEAGTTFGLCFELVLRKEEGRAELLQGFALALSGLEKGEIPLGKRKRRGFGRCHATNWRVQRHDMTTPAGMLGWLRDADQKKADAPPSGVGIAELLTVNPLSLPRPAFVLDAFFALDSSLLIRSVPDELSSADTAHLRSARIEDGKRVVRSILSGTSLAGALRARALRIANTLGKDGKGFVDHLFGYRPTGKGDSHPMSASRLWVDETVINNPLALVQSRVKIDRFTGGSFPGALFAEEALFAANDTRLRVCVRLENGDTPLRQDAEIGLLLLLLKDLWTGDLPLGGESSIGRGRLRGEFATLAIGEDEYTIRAQGNGGLQMTDGAQIALESYVTKWGEWGDA